MPNVPVTVWEQIPVIVVFAFLLAGMGWLLMKAFSSAIADINKHYAAIITSSNEQWQKYMDAKTAMNDLVSRQMVEKLEGLTVIIQKLQTDFEKHDEMEMHLLDVMQNRMDAQNSARSKHTGSLKQ